MHVKWLCKELWWTYSCVAIMTILEFLPPSNVAPRTSQQTTLCPTSRPRQPLMCLLSLQFCLLEKFHVNGITRHAALCVQFLSLSIMLLKFTLSVACVKSALLPNFMVWIWHTASCLPTQQLMDTYAVWVLALRSNAAEHWCEVFAGTYVSISLETDK